MTPDAILKSSTGDPRPAGPPTPPPTPVPPTPGPTSSSEPTAPPHVRVTAGRGTAGEKSWNLRRPVTLIGCQRKAHIVLHGLGISKAHCVIVNTGTTVLLKDLHTPEGTTCNGERVDLVSLRNGDVLQIGATHIEISIQRSDGRPARKPASDAEDAETKLAQPTTIYDLRTGQNWSIEAAVAMIGQDPAAEIPLDGEEVTAAHAVVFQHADGLGVFDLGSLAGTRIDEVPLTTSAWCHGQSIEIGSHRLSLDPEAPGNPPAVDAQAHGGAAGGLSESAPSTTAHETPGSSREPDAANEDSAHRTDHHAHSLAEVEMEVASLKADIARTWERFNTSERIGGENPGELNVSPSELLELAGELNEKDAALRGHLHDLTQCYEQLVEREREIAVQSTRLHEERLKLFQDQAAIAKRKAELSRRAIELDRKEKILNDRMGGAAR